MLINHKNELFSGGSVDFIRSFGRHNHQMCASFKYFFLPETACKRRRYDEDNTRAIWQQLCISENYSDDFQLRLERDKSIKELD